MAYTIRTRPLSPDIREQCRNVLRKASVDVLLRCLLLTGLLIPSAFAVDVSTLEPRGYVNDFAAVMDPADAAAIETYLGNVERSTGVQMAVVTIPSLEGDSIEDVGIRLVEQWGIGNQQDEGLMVLLAIEDRESDVEVGYGLEGIIPDGYAGRVLREIRPILRQGNYGGALMATVQQFALEIAEAKGVTIEGQPASARRITPRQGVSLGQIIGIVIMIVFFASLFGAGRGGGPRGRGGGGRGGDILTAMILGGMLGGGGRHRGGWGGGGFGGFDGGGGGGFGGFGGGGFGGGGASGNW